MDHLKDYQTPNGSGTVIGKCLTFGEIEALLAAERERCAKVAHRLVEESSRQEWHHAGSPLGEYFKGRGRAAQTICNLILALPPQTEGGQT